MVVWFLALAYAVLARVSEHAPIFRFEDLVAKIQANDPGFLSLNLPHANLDDNMLVPLFYAMKNNTVLEEVALPGNTFSEDGAVELLKMLTGAQQLKKLSLANNRLTAITAAAMGDLLAHESCQLEWLDISFNTLEAHGAELVATGLTRPFSSLRYLDIGFNKIGEAGFFALAEMVQHNSNLKHLHARRNNAAFYFSLPEAAEAASQDSPDIQYPGRPLLPDTSEEEEEGEGAGENREGKKEKGAEKEEGNARAARVLKEQKEKLEKEAEEKKGKEEEEGAVLYTPAMFEVDKQAVLDLNTTGRPAKDKGGLAAFALALQHNTAIQSLSLGNKDPEGRDAMYFGFANKVDSKGFDFLLSSLRAQNTVRVLDLKGCEVQSPLSMSLLADMLISKQIKFTTLHLEANMVDDEGAAKLASALARDVPLRTLSVGSQISNKGLGALCSSLKHNTQLVDLSLEQNLIDSSGVEHLVDALPWNRHLQLLSLSKNEQIGNAGVQRLLSVLHTTRTVDKPQYKYLRNAGLYGLKLDQVGLDSADVLYGSLSSDVLLQYISLSKNPLADAGLAAVGRAIEKGQNTNLRSVVMQETGVTDEGLVQFAESMGKAESWTGEKSALQNLVLSNNYLTDTSGVAFAAALQRNPSISGFYAGKNSLTDATAHALISALTHPENANMATIDLSQNSVDPELEQKLAVRLWELARDREDKERGSQSPTASRRAGAGAGEADGGLPPVANLAISLGLMYGIYRLIGGGAAPQV